MVGGVESERSDEVEELATVCESSGGMVGVVCGSKSISPSERTRFLGELAAQRETLVPEDVSSDKISTSSSSRSSSSELTSDGLDVRGAISRPRAGMYEGKGELSRWACRGACGRDDSQSRIRCTKPSEASVM